MKNPHFTRRQLLKASGPFALASLAPTESLAQTSGAAPLPAHDYAQRHFDTVVDIVSAYGTVEPISKAGLHLLVDFLVKRELIAREDAELLHGLVDGIFDSKQVEAVLKAIQDLDERASKAGRFIVQVVAKIAASSVDLARKQLDQVDVARVVYVVGSDVTGALAGIATAPKAPPALPALAALAGAAANSSKAVWDTRKSQKSQPPQ